MTNNRKSRRRSMALARSSAKRNLGSLVPNQETAAFRTSLLGAAAAGAMMFTPLSTATAQVVDTGGNGMCLVAGTTVTCSGDLAGGLVATGPAVETLNINNLTTAITPAAGVDGVAFNTTSGNNIIINSDTGAFGITTTGIGRGYDVFVSNNGNITMTTAGPVAGNNDAFELDVSNDGNITLMNTGDVNLTNGKAFDVRVGRDGDIALNNTGDVTTANNDAFEIDVVGDGNINVTSVGNISALGPDDHGFELEVNGNGNIVLNSTGDVSTDGEAFDLFVDGTGNGNITLTSVGNITSVDAEAIEVELDGIGDIIITSTGNITTQSPGGSEAVEVDHDGTGNIIITSVGDIVSDSDGFEIDQEGTGDITINSTGNVTANANDGIEGDTDNGSVTIISKGDVVAADGAIEADADGFGNTGSVTITSVGNLTGDSDGSGTGTAVTAIADGTGSVTVNLTGNASGGADAVVARLNNAANTSAINITSSGNVTGDSEGNGTGRGIFAEHDGLGDVDITSTGNVAAGTQAIEVNATNAASTGKITITSVGTITGDADANGNGHGIEATHAGAGMVEINSTGNITAGQDGILSSVAAGGMTTVNLLGGNVAGGTGAGVNFDGPAGTTNTLNISGNVSLSSTGGSAVMGGDGDTTVNVTGTLNTLTNGVIDLGAGANAFNIASGGTFNAGPVVTIGAGNLFTNDGTLSPGGEGVVASTAITGNFTQSGSGILLTDLDSTAQTADRTNITGTASVAGTVQVKLANSALGAQTQTILSAAGGTTNNGLGLVASPVLQAELQFPNANDVVISTDINFAAPGANLNANQTSVGAALNGVLGAGSGALSPAITALLEGITSDAELASALDQLGAEIYLNGSAAAQAGAQVFADQLFSCQVNGTQYAAIAEGSCIWVRPNVRHAQTDTTGANVGFEDTAGGASIGGQTEYQPGWFLGGALGIEYGDTDNTADARAKRTTVNGGLSVKHVAGPWALSAAVFGGSIDYEVQRTMNFGGFVAANNAEFDARYFGGQVRAAYLFDYDPGYLKPLVDFNVTHVSFDGATETGTAATALTTNGFDRTYFAVSPALEFGTDVQLKNDYTARFYGKVGATISGDDDTTVTARFTNAPAGTGSFNASSSTDNVFGDVELGVTLFNENKTTIQLGYQGSFSENTESHGGFAKAMFKF